MRILEAFGEPVSFGGQESFVMNVLDNMDMTGLSFDMLSPYYCDNEDIVSRMEEYGGHVYTLGCRFRPGGIRNGECKPVRQFLNTHEYDVIHIHSGSNSMLAMLARLASEAGIPDIIVHSHCTGRPGPKHAASKILTARSLRKYPTAYCACSRAAGEWRFPEEVCRNELIVINNGIDTDKFRFDEKTRSEMREELGIDAETVLVGCVGRLTYQKNQSFLLDVMDAVNAGPSEDRRYKLILVGEGEDHEMLERKAEKLGLSKDVIFTGAVTNVRAYLQAMDVAAMPSRYEGLAIAVIEAQASGLEILASNGVPEAAAVTDAVTFINTFDKYKWAEEVVKKHVRHPEQAELVASHGYDIKESADTVRKLYIPD